MGIKNQSFKPKNYRSVRVGTYQHADLLLKYHIASLQGKGFKSNWIDRIRLARGAIEVLTYFGYHWHASRLLNWIHRCYKTHKGELKEKQPKADSLDPERERDSLNLDFNYRSEGLKH